MGGHGQVLRGIPAQGVHLVPVGEVGQGGQGGILRLVFLPQGAVAGEVVEEVEEVQLGHIVIVAGEEPAHRRGVGDAVPLHVGEEGLVDPVYLLLGQGTGLCRR